MKQVLFGFHHEWFRYIWANLDMERYRPSVAPLSLVNLAHFDAVVPLGEADYGDLASLRHWRGLKFVMPDPQVVALCEDKLAFAERLIMLGFGEFVPEIYPDHPRYPYIRKPRHGVYGSGCQIVRNRWSDRGMPPVDADHFDQAVVPGRDEYALHILRVDGRIRYHQGVAYRMARPMLVRGEANVPRTQEKFDASEMVAIFEPLLAALDYSGTCCINYKLSHGRPMILEINARFGGSLVSDITRYLDAYLAVLEEHAVALPKKQPTAPKAVLKVARSG